MRDHLIAKAVVVSGDVVLDEEYDKYYVPEEDMYVFYSISYLDDQGNFSGTRLLHDTIINKLNLPHIPSNMINYVSVDVKATDRRHTYLFKNNRGYRLSPSQIDYLKDFFDVDY